MPTRRPDPDRLAPFLALLDVAERVHRGSRARKRSDKKLALDSVRQFRELAAPGIPQAGLRQLERDFLVEWNEGVGPEVEAFWRAVQDAGLPFPRKRDVVAETLARGRIGNMHEYVALEDQFEALQTCGKITEADAEALDRMLNAFADAPENQQFFEDGGEPPEPAEPVEPPEPPAVDVGQLVSVAPGSYRFDWVGLELTNDLQARGWQGGGESWAGIVQALLDLHAPDVLPLVRLDPEAGCLAVWATDPAPLQVVASLVARALRDRDLLLRAIAHAEATSSME